MALSVSGPGDLATWVSVALTLVAGAAAVSGFVMLRRRERRQALTDLHVALTSGEIAQARNTVGAVLYSSDSGPTRTQAIEAYFALVWAVQRARNVFRTYGIRWRPLDAPQHVLTRVMRAGHTDAAFALTWNLTEMAESVVRFRDLHRDDWEIDDDDAWADIGQYIDAHELRRI